MGKILKKPVDNNRKSRITSAKAISVLIVVLWVLSGALVRGLQVKTTYGKIQMPEEELEKLSGSEDSPYKEMARQVFDNSFGKQISITLFWHWLLLGGLAGLTVGLFIIVFAGKTIFSKSNVPAAVPIGKNLLFVFGFSTLSFVVWALLMILFIELDNETTTIRWQVINHYTALFAFLISWLALGRKINIGSGLRKFLGRLLLGLFDTRSIQALSIPQKKIIWTTLAIIFFLLLFPPRLGLSLEACEYVPEFIGLHFIAATKYQIVLDSPYEKVQFDSKTLGTLLFAFFATGALGLIYCNLKPGSCKKV